MRRLCDDAYCSGPVSQRCRAMDLVYLIFLFVLVALTAGYLWLCGRLEDRK